MPGRGPPGTPLRARPRSPICLRHERSNAARGAPPGVLLAPPGRDVARPGRPGRGPRSRHAVPERPRLRREERRRLRTLRRPGPGQHDRARRPRGVHPARRRGGRHGHPWRRAGAHAGAHRRALAHHAACAPGGRGDLRGHRLSQPRRRGERRGHAHARLHLGARHGRAGLRPQARDRLRHRGGTAHLPVGGHDHPDRGARGLPVPLRAPAREHEPAVPHRGPGFVLHRRRRARGAAPGARAARARRLPDQARGGGRRLLPGPRGDHRLLRRRAPGGRRGGPELGDLRQRARLLHGIGAAGDRRRRPGHRPRPPDRRRHGEAHGGEGDLVEPAALPRRRGPDPAAGRPPPRRAGRGDRRHRPGLRAGEEVRGQDRLRDGHPLRRPDGEAARRPAGEDGALVHPGARR